MRQFGKLVDIVRRRVVARPDGSPMVRLADHVLLLAVGVSDVLGNGGDPTGTSAHGADRSASAGHDVHRRLVRRPRAARKLLADDTLDRLLGGGRRHPIIPQPSNGRMLARRNNVDAQRDGSVQ